MCGLDGVVAAAQGVVHLLLGERRFAFIGHLPARAPKVKLHHVAVLGVLNAVVVRPRVELPVLGSAGFGLAEVKGRHVSLPHLVLHVEPGRAAQGLHHGVQGRARLLRVLLAGVGGGLCPRGVGRGKQHQGQRHR
jgi:hypothetical protein